MSIHMSTLMSTNVLRCPRLEVGAECVSRGRWSRSEMGATGRRGPREGGPRSGPAGVLGSNGEGVRAETSPDAALGNGARALRRCERVWGAQAPGVLARAMRATAASAD